MHFLFSQEMLKERGVAPFSKWEKELPKLVFDARFKVCEVRHRCLSCDLLKSAKFVTVLLLPNYHLWPTDTSQCNV